MVHRKMSAAAAAETMNRPHLQNKTYAIPGQHKARGGAVG